MLHNLTGWHALIILAVVLLVFGSTKLPALAKSVGQSVRILKDEAGTSSEGRLHDDDTVRPVYADANADRPAA